MSRWPLSVARILEHAANRHITSIDSIVGPSQLENVVAARHMAMRDLRRIGLSLTAIGKHLGGRHHTTVLHAVGPRTGRKDNRGRRLTQPDRDLIGVWDEWV